MCHLLLVAPSGGEQWNPIPVHLRNEGRRRTSCGFEEGYTIGEVAMEDPLEEKFSHDASP
jgi:hypothetical protein